MIDSLEQTATERTSLHAESLFREDQNAIHRQTDRLFAGLMIFQWVGCMLFAFWFSPRAWVGSQSSTHVHVWAALFLGGAIASIPVVLAALQPGKPLTRHVIAVGQMLFSALLIHLTGGRIETHFHVFGSLAFLAFYRDWKVLVTASAVVALDHGLRGFFWPQSVYGVLSATFWRTGEHAGWVVFEDVFLFYSIREGLREMRSVSERQAKLEALNQNIEQEVKERTHQLSLEIAERKRGEAAIEANKAKSEFLSRVSHELRTPLNAILGFGQLLETSSLEEEDRDNVGQILKGGRHLLGLINEVLDLERIESGRLTLSPEPVFVYELVEEAIALIKPLMTQRGLQLLWERNANCEQFIKVDRQKLKQVVLNVLSNAMKYNRHGGTVTVLCRTMENRHLRIEVTDAGQGIPEHKLDRLFTPFDRLGAEGSGVEGTGLGLALSQRLVRAMNGEIGVESALGKGSTFWIDFPIVKDPIIEEEAIFKPSEVGKQNEFINKDLARTILYIEDNLSNLTLVERILKRRPGFKLISAMQGQLGLDLAREHNPALILLDLHLPDMMGIEVLRRLRAEPRTRNTPVIVISADATQTQSKRLRAEGVDEYLTKPINVESFLEAMDRLVESKDRAASCTT